MDCGCYTQNSLIIELLFFFFFQFRERTILKEKKKKKKKKKKAYGVLLLAINGQLFQEKRAWELVYTLVANLCYA